MASTRHRMDLRCELMNGTLEGLFWSPWGSHAFQGILWSFSSHSRWRYFIADSHSICLLWFLPELLVTWSLAFLVPSCIYSGLVLSQMLQLFFFFYFWLLGDVYSGFQAHFDFYLIFQNVCCSVSFGHFFGCEDLTLNRSSLCWLDWLK